MNVDIKFLLRQSTGDRPIAAESELRELLQSGQCRPSDFLYDFVTAKWMRAGEHPAVSSLFGAKPTTALDRRVIYFLPPGVPATSPLGPFSTKEIQARAQSRELCAFTWVFVEGDKEWRQVRNVKVLNEMLPALPADVPTASSAAQGAAPTAEEPSVALSLSRSQQGDAPPSFAPPPTPAPGASAPPPFRPGHDNPPEPEMPSMPSISLDMGSPASPAAPSDDDPHVEREEVTMAMDMMGLNLHSEHATPPPAPPRQPVKPVAASLPPAPAPSPRATPSAEAAQARLPGKAKDLDGFDGIVAEIPADPIWLVKQANGETVSGPFRFLEVVQFLEQGKLSKNDKIARTGTKAFTKIAQQYEFNVKFSVETVVENGQEKQKILIRRRHPRVPYITGVQIVSKHGLLAGQCMNISAGGILMEAAKAEFNLGEIIEVKILPGLIAKSITCKSLIIGKIPKIPPGYALKFEDLKPEDKEAIEYYVQETLKREMSKKL